MIAEQNAHKQQDGSLVICKVLFFIYLGLSAAFIPFIPLFFDAAGGSQVEIGIVSGARPFLGLISMPLFGYAADKLNRHKAFLFGLIVLTSLLRFGLLWCSSFLAVASLILLSDFSGNPITSIIDSTVLDALPDPLLYGRQRLWGTIAWGSMAPLAGQAISAFGTSISIWIHTAGNLVLLVVVSRLRVSPPPPSTGSVWDAWRVILRDPQTLCLLLVVVVMGQAYGAIGTFLFLRLQELGGSPLLMGLTLAVNCAVEAPTFHFSGAAIQRLGLIGVLVLCPALMALRLSFYGVLESPWPVLLVEGIHGITFGLLWSAGTVTEPPRNTRVRARAY
jgi:MFS transporter, PPP family, 3-phenylpropionic acid transporter